MEKIDRSKDKRHPMKVVVRRTGLTSHAVRVWERRYQAVEPARTETNRRLYSDADIERLQLLHQATRQGQQIGQIARLSMEELAELAGARSAPVLDPIPSSALIDPASCVERSLEAVRSLDTTLLEDELARAAVSLSRKKLLEEVIHPLMLRTGDLWAEGSLRIAHEHLASSVVRNVLGSMQSSDMVPATAPTILFTTPTGQLHEIGALMAATVAASEGWRVTYLGPNLPAEEIAGAALQERVRAIALSVIYPADDPRLDAELVKLRRSVGADVPILIGGRAAVGYGNLLDRIDAVHVADLTEFPRHLDALRSRIPSI
jgi:MerR family transcriptional regulator, light-induced transcriptional regulator